MDDLLMRRVFVASPLASTTKEGVQRNIHRARMLCLSAMKLEGVAAFAPHTMYPEFLDDSDTEDRELGKQAGQTWMETADEIWVFTKAGITGGMREEIELADALKIPVIYDPPCFEEVEA